MPEAYYVIRLEMDDAVRDGTWSISDYPTDANGREFLTSAFCSGELWLGSPPLQIGLLRSGRPLPFEMLGMEVPIVDPRTESVLSPFLPQSTQRIRATILSDAGPLDYTILNIVEMPDCLDAVRSEFTRWQPHELQPWRNPLGHLFIRPAIRREAILGLHCFRLRNWGQNRLIVSEAVREALGEAGVGFLRFEAVLLV